MSETKTRADVGRYYITRDGLIVRRVKDQVVATSPPLPPMSSLVASKLVVEGIIARAIAGMSFEEIWDGEKLPDRSLPAGQTKAPGVWVQAIAMVRAEDIVRRKRAAGEKPTKADIEGLIYAEALAWAKRLTDDQVKQLRKSAHVKTAFGKLTGKHESLDDLLASVETKQPEQASDALDHAAE